MLIPLINIYGFNIKKSEIFVNTAIIKLKLSLGNIGTLLSSLLLPRVKFRFFKEFKLLGLFRLYALV